MPYSVTPWINNATPALNATNLNKLKNELASQAAAKGVAHSLPTWVNGAPPAVSDAAPLNEMERVLQAVATSLGLSYTVTTWSSGWTPARNAANLNKMEAQAQANRAAIDTTPPGFPASYFTGPLGAGNVLPATTTGKLLIMWCGVGGNTEAQQRALYVQRMNDCGRTFDGIQFQGSQLTVSGQNGEDWCHSLGILPIHVWNTGTSTATVVSGGANAAIDTEITRLKTKPYKIMIRLMHEFNLSNTPYYGLGNPTQFVQAWQYIVNRFAAQGATNCGFWWCPTEQAGDPDRAAIDNCYPGHTYVDWVGTDGYNNGTSGYSAPPPAGPGWADFDRIFNYDFYGASPPTFHLPTPDVYGPNKPWFAGETGSKYDPGNASRKANWFREIDSVAVGHMPYLRGLTFFDTWAPGEGNDWMVDSNQPQGTSARGSADATTYQGWKDFAAIARWNVGRIGG